MTEQYFKNYKQYVELLRKAPDDLDFEKLCGASIITSKQTTRVLFYFIKHGAASSWVLQVKLKLAEATVYRALKNIRKYDLIVEALKASSKDRSRGGPKPVIWALWDATPDQVGNALKLHYEEYAKREPEIRAQKYR